MKHIRAAKELHEKYPEILKGFHKILQDHGVRDVSINGVEFLHQADASGGADCPPGTVAQQVCVPKPGGGVYCYSTCVPLGGSGGGD